MKSIFLAGALALGLIGVASAQDNAAGTSNGTFQNPKPGATLFGSMFGQPSQSEASHQEEDANRERSALRAIVQAKSLEEAKRLAADALR